MSGGDDFWMIFGGLGFPGSSDELDEDATGVGILLFLRF